MKMIAMFLLIAGAALTLCGVSFGYEIPGNPDARPSLDLFFSKTTGKGSGVHSYLGFGGLGWTQQDIAVQQEIVGVTFMLPVNRDATVYISGGRLTDEYRRKDGMYVIDPTFVGTGYSSKVTGKAFKVGVKVYLP